MFSLKLVSCFVCFVWGTNPELALFQGISSGVTWATICGAGELNPGRSQTKQAPRMYSIQDSIANYLCQPTLLNIFN